VAKVEALLEAATGLDRKEVLGMVGRAAKPLVQQKLAELDTVARSADCTPGAFKIRNNTSKVAI
jgi:hypothetical protein